MIKTLFFGTPEFAVPALRELVSMPEVEVVAVVTQPDKVAGRGNEVAPPPVKKAALEYGLSVMQPVKLRKELGQFLNKVSRYGDIDVGVVVAYGQILPASLLSFPRCGMVNIHASLLPRWRGAAPIQRAILAGDKITGVTLMQVDEGLDTGGIYCSSEVPIDDSDNFEALHRKLSEEGARLLSKALSKICSGELKPVPQPEDGATYADKITKEEALIVWDNDKEYICRQIRAFSPIPCAYTQFNGKRLKIYKASPQSYFAGQRIACPGTVVFVDVARVEVACKNGVVSLEEVQLEGRRRMGIREFLRGAAIKEGVK
ncbi:MAG: methionyl-tRNA formyltransferase, partial [Candidatus Dadabacteria bacterium]